MAGFKGVLWAQSVWLFFAYERPPGHAVHRDLAAVLIAGALRTAAGTSEPGGRNQPRH